MIKNETTGELEYDSREIPGKEYTVVTIDGDIVTNIPSELKARGIQRRSAGSICYSSDIDTIMKLSNQYSHMWDDRKIELGLEITNTVKTTKYQDLCQN